MRDVHHAGSVALGDRGGAIGRCVVRHDQLVGLVQSLPRRVQCVERRAEQIFFVVSRDNERDQTILRLKSDEDLQWGVSTVALPGSVAPGASVTFSFSVVAPMTLASYNFQWQMNLQASGPFGLASPPTAVQVVAAGPPNFGGLWWNAPAGSESGWGINLAHQGDVIFATWFTYDLTGKGWWLTMTAPKTAANTYSGTLVKSIGPAFDAVPFNPARVAGTSVGTGTLTFTDTNNGSFAYTVNGVSQTKTL